MLTDALGYLERLHEAVPDAWRYDRLFRVAVIGAGAALISLVLHSAEPSSGAQTRFVEPPPAQPRQSSGGHQVPSSEPLRIQPGLSLDRVTVAPILDGDKFGIYESGKLP